VKDLRHMTIDEEAMNLTRRKLEIIQLIKNKKLASCPFVVEAERKDYDDPFEKEWAIAKIPDKCSNDKVVFKHKHDNNFCTRPALISNYYYSVVRKI
jgi:hypothetical protein